MKKVKDLVLNILFVLAFFFVASGMLEALILALLEKLGL